MVHCGRIGKGIVGIFRPAWTDSNGKAAKFTRSDKAIFVGNIVAQEQRPGTGKRLNRHERAHRCTLIRTGPNQFGNELAALERKVIVLGKLRHEMRSVVLNIRVATRVERSAMNLAFIVQPSPHSVIGNLRNDIVGQRLCRMAQDGPIRQALVGTMRSRTRYLQLTDVMQEVIERASTHHRQTTVKSLRQPLQPIPEIVGYIYSFWCRCKIDQSTIKVEE